MIKKIVCLLTILIIACTSFVYAEDKTENNADNTQKYISDGEITSNDLEWYKPSSPQNSNYDQITPKVQKVLGAIQVIGMIVSVAVLMILGIKFMLGSVEEKADYKRAFIPYLIGAVILFTGTTLPNIIYNWTHNTIG